MKFFQAYCYMVDKYVKTLILVIQLRPKPMMMHLALRLIHTACRYTQELKARIGGEFELTKVRVCDPAVKQIGRVWCYMQSNENVLGVKVFHEIKPYVLRTHHFGRMMLKGTYDF